MSEAPVTVRVFGSLRPERVAAGLPCTFEIELPPEGRVARDIAEDLGLPLDRVEGVFVNHTVRPVSDVVHPGDRIAFVPNDTPGPHRVFLGLYGAGKSSDD